MLSNRFSSLSLGPQLQCFWVSQFHLLFTIEIHLNRPVVHKLVVCYFIDSFISKNTPRTAVMHSTCAKDSNKGKLETIPSAVINASSFSERIPHESLRIAAWLKWSVKELVCSIKNFQRVLVNVQLTIFVCFNENHMTKFLKTTMKTMMSMWQTYLSVQCKWIKVCNPWSQSYIYK